MKLFWILNDQLHQKYIKTINKSEDTILFIEDYSEFTRHSYHKQRIFFLIAAMRNFAIKLEKEGYRVEYIKEKKLSEAFQKILKNYEKPEIKLSLPMDYDFREKIKDTMVKENKITWTLSEIGESNFLFTEKEALAMLINAKTQESFYRKARIQKNILVTKDKKPIGGKWNFDASNRKPPNSIEEIPKVLEFRLNDISKKALEDCQNIVNNFPGNQWATHLPVTRIDALAWINDFIENRLEHFGPYQDAMVSKEPFMFHSLISAHINCGLIQAEEIVELVVKAYKKGNVPLSSAEGFIRQVLGWREYVRAIYLRDMPNYSNHNYFNHSNSLPTFYWSGKTDMNCLQECIHEVLEYGYSHHIQRLMILSNFANLLFVHPLELSSWFNQMYTDSWDWVVVPNVIGMSTYADGGIMGTKPYVSSGAYINKMSTYCKDCTYKIKEKTTDQACPFNALYWNFIGTHQDRLKGNPRMGLMISQWNKMEKSQQKEIQKKASEIQKLYHG